MKIQHKRSAVAIGGVAKEPTAAQTEQGELCVNFSTETLRYLLKTQMKILFVLVET